uniref:Mannosyl-glycoprotein endo-beta-N-acetylglucosaminidase n=1 Tax=Romanomermis culicivorax TaxID=13658 RepID=A0A915JJB3_ROMCU
MEIIKPLTSLDELLSFSTEYVAPEMIARNLCDTLEKTPKNQPKLLVCHDMAGNYHEDKFCGGCPSEDPYYLTAWPYIDIFVYFSHNLVTIPTVGWTNCAHLHNVSVLGTFITEFDEGAKISERLLENRTIIDQACEKLSDIALKYNFDGWLLNIENVIQFDHVPNLAYFVQKLTELCKMKLGNERSQVIWYDSVTINGDLKWQNELNELNEMFFLLCDGIFLNYTWKDENLHKSCDFVARINQHHVGKSQIFVGVDAFGRGCLGGGGFECRLAFREINKFALSMALFAPAWPYEHLGAEDFAANNFEFWKLIAQFKTCRKYLKLPISTTFNIGKFIGCKNDDDDNKHCMIFNLSDQNQQPHFFCGGKSSDEIKSIIHEFDHKFPTGQALTFELESQRPVCCRLFCCQIPIKSIFTIRLEFMTENSSLTNEFSIELSIKLGYFFHGDKRNVISYKIGTENSKKSEEISAREEWQIEVNPSTLSDEEVILEFIDFGACSSSKAKIYLFKFILS